MSKEIAFLWFGNDEKEENTSEKKVPVKNINTYKKVEKKVVVEKKVENIKIVKISPTKINNLVSSGPGEVFLLSIIFTSFLFTFLIGKFFKSKLA